MDAYSQGGFQFQVQRVNDGAGAHRLLKVRQAQ